MITHEESRKKLISYMEQQNLIDVWRYLNPDKFRFTWKRTTPEPVFVRLDFFLVTEIVYQSILNADIKPGFQSDHSLPYIDLCFETCDRGPGYWKMNTTLLDDQDFCSQLKS